MMRLLLGHGLGFAGRLILVIQLSWSSTSSAANYCEGKPDSEVRLDQKGKSLENSKILDQDSLGVCYATAASTALQSALPGHPEVSYLDYALQYKKNDYNGKFVKIMNPNPKDPGTILDGGLMCDEFEDIKKKGICPRNKITLETLSTQNPDLQIESFRGIGSFFDLQKNSTPEKRKVTAKAILNGLSMAREGAKEECAKFPSNMKKLLEKVYQALKKSIEWEKISIRNDLTYSKPRLIEELNKMKSEREALVVELNDLKSKKKNQDEQHSAKLAKIEKNKNSLLNQVLKERPKRQNEREEARYQDQSYPLSLKLKIKENEISFRDLSIKMKQSELDQIIKQEKKISDMEASLKKIGTEVTDENSKVANATKVEISEEVSQKLQNEYREAIKKINPDTWQTNLFSDAAEKFVKNLGIPMTYDVKMSLWDTGLKLEADAMELNPDRCFKRYVDLHCDTLKKTMKTDMSCGDPNLADPAVKMMSSLNSLISANANSEALLEKMGNNPYEFIEELMGSTCENKDRIKIPSTLKCTKHQTLEVVLNHPSSKPFDSEQVTQLISNQLRNDSIKSLKNQRAVLLSVCADMFDSLNADSSYGWGCATGGHAVTLIGYRCKAGKLNYLIQNSWGSSGGPYGDGAEHDHGRVWVPERLVIRNMMNYGILDGAIK